MMDEKLATVWTYKRGYTDGFESAQPKWISVEERLPEPDAKVLAYIASKKAGVDSVIAITSYTHNMHGFNITGWRSPWQYCFWDREITHWMPLPEPPSCSAAYGWPAMRMTIRKIGERRRKSECASI